MTRDQIIRRLVKPAVFIVCLGPLAWFAWLGASGGLGANPIEATIRYFGEWGLRFLILALAVTPVRELTGVSAVGRFRRMIGLYAFFYITLHLMAYVGLDQFFDLGAIWADIVKRVYITVGMAAFLLLLPLAITSTKGWMKRLTGKRWQKLHRVVYLDRHPRASSISTMMVKADFREPLVYGANPCRAARLAGG